MKILSIFYLFFLIFDVSKLQSCWKVVVRIKKMFYFLDNSLPYKPQAQSKVITRQQAYMYFSYTTKVNPFINMYEEDFENIQRKQRPFPFI